MFKYYMTLYMHWRFFYYLKKNVLNLEGNIVLESFYKFYKCGKKLSFFFKKK